MLWEPTQNRSSHLCRHVKTTKIKAKHIQTCHIYPLWHTWSAFWKEDILNRRLKLGYFTYAEQIRLLRLVTHPCLSPMHNWKLTFCGPAAWTFCHDATGSVATCHSGYLFVSNFTKLDFPTAAMQTACIGTLPKPGLKEKAAIKFCPI